MISPIFARNIRGIGSSRGRLKKLVASLKPKVVALMEPFQNFDKAQGLMRLLLLDNVISNVDGGKFWVFYSWGVVVQISRLGSQFISLIVGEGSYYFSCTFIYA